MEAVERLERYVFVEVRARGDYGRSQLLEPGLVRVSMRSKYDVDVRSVAALYGGGGHTNAAGFTVSGNVNDVRGPVIEKLLSEIERATSAREAGLADRRA